MRRLHPVIEYAKNYGHFFNRQYPRLLELQDAKRKTLAKIEEGHSLFRDALASIQGFDANMDVLSKVYHGRQAMFDGVMGPASEALLSLKRCRCPDFVSSLEATGSGGWPVGCDPERPEVHSHRVRVNTSGAGS